MTLMGLPCNAVFFIGRIWNEKWWYTGRIIYDDGPLEFVRMIYVRGVVFYGSIKYGIGLFALNASDLLGCSNLLAKPEANEKLSIIMTNSNGIWRIKCNFKYS